MAGLIRRKPRAQPKPEQATVPRDPGLQHIDAWLTAFAAFNEGRLRRWPEGDALDAERAKVQTLAATIGERLREELRARSGQR